MQGKKDKNQRKKEQSLTEIKEDGVLASKSTTKKSKNKKNGRKDDVMVMVGDNYDENDFSDDESNDNNDENNERNGSEPVEKKIDNVEESGFDNDDDDDNDEDDTRYLHSAVLRPQTTSHSLKFIPNDSVSHPEKKSEKKEIGGDWQAMIRTIL